MNALPFVSVLIPVYNEQDILEASAEKVHAFLEQRGIAHEVLVVSNGSTDRTNEIGRTLAARCGWFRFCELAERGVGRAFSHAVKNARGEFLISLDVDLSFDLRFVDYAVDLLKHADMVVGSKTLGRQRRSLLRVIASQSYILCAQLFFDLTVSDYSIGCKAYRRAAILPVIDNLDLWTGYVFELCLYMRRQGKSVVQVGVDCDDRRRSHFSLLHEGWYRYRHLYRCGRVLRSPGNWFTRQLALLAYVCAFALMSAFSARAEPPSAQEIRIGVILPMSGEGAWRGANSLDIGEHAVFQMTAEGARRVDK